MIGIYKITNKLNGKCYIGKAYDIELRLSQHKEAILTSNKSWYPEARLESNSINDFEFSILQECDYTELDELEEYWIKYYKSYENGYNKTKDGQFNSNHNDKIYCILNKSLKSSQIISAMKNMKGNTFKLYLYFYLKQIENPYECLAFIPSIISKETGLGINAPRIALQDLIKLGYCIQDNNDYYLTFK